MITIVNTLTKHQINYLELLFKDSIIHNIGLRYDGSLIVACTRGLYSTMETIIIPRQADPNAVSLAIQDIIKLGEILATNRPQQ